MSVGLGGLRGVGEEFSDGWRAGVVERIRVRYSGRVQGVGFRATALSLAQGYPITGWVRNDPDGAVTLEAQGAAEDVREFLEAVRSRMGKLVSAADEARIAVHEDSDSFDIRR